MKCTLNGVTDKEAFEKVAEGLSQSYTLFKSYDVIAHIEKYEDDYISLYFNNDGKLLSFDCLSALEECRRKESTESINKILGVDDNWFPEENSICISPTDLYILLFDYTNKDVFLRFAQRMINALG